MIAVADTHAVIWFLSADPKLSAIAKAFMDSAVTNGDEIAISSISLIEMVYLIGKGRIPPNQFTNLSRELGDPESIFVEAPVDLKIARTLSRVDVSKIADMPDRIIAATALSLGVPIISRDRKIQLSSLATIW